MTPFGTLSTGETVHAVTLANGTLTARVLTYGAILQDLHLTGVDHPLTLGFTEIAAYEDNPAFFGTVVAPVINRIAGAEARIDGATRRFAANAGAHTLHSGPTGSHSAPWSVSAQSDTALTLTLRQAAGLGGFPGNRDLTVVYALEGDTLAVSITATSDAPTLMNAGHHGYWNLDGTPTWDGHRLSIAAEHYLPCTDEVLPTGEIAPVAGTPYDFRAARILNADTAPFLDLNFCLAEARRTLHPVLRLQGASGLALDLATTEPGVQIYDASTISPGGRPTIHGRAYGPRCGIAIEPQAWPNAPHNPAFPQIGLAPGETYRQHSTYRFHRP